jgi:hypothetical protein
VERSSLSRDGKILDILGESEWLITMELFMPERISSVQKILPEKRADVKIMKKRFETH